MKKLFIIQDSLTNKISFYLVILFAASLPFDRFYSEVILASFAIHTVIHFKRSEGKGFRIKPVLLLQGIFFLTLLASIPTLDTPNVYVEWEKQLGIFLFPLLFAITPLDLKKHRTQFLTAFATGCTVAIIYLEAEAIQVIHYTHLPFSALFSDAFINHNFSDPLEIHPTYLSMYVALSVAFLLSLFFSHQSVMNRTACGLCILLLSLSLLQLGSKAVLVAFLFLMILFPFFRGSRQNNRKLVFLGVLLLTLTIVTIYSSGTLKTRFISGFINDVTDDGIGKTKNEYRIVRWEAAIDLIKQSPVIGFGTGSEIPLLQKKYFEKKLYNSFINGLNAHNEYLSFMIKAGIIGLSLFLFTLYWGFSSSIKKRDFVMFSFLVIIAAVSFSENILEVNKGIFYYSFFFSLFVFARARQAHFSQMPRQPFKHNKRFYDEKTMSVI